MIRGLLARIADHVADTRWLRSMRYREVQATRSAQRIERKEGIEPADEYARLNQKLFGRPPYYQRRQEGQGHGHH